MEFSLDTAHVQNIAVLAVASWPCGGSQAPTLGPCFPVLWTPPRTVDPAVLTGRRSQRREQRHLFPLLVGERKRKPLRLASARKGRLVVICFPNCPLPWLTLGRADQKCSDKPRQGEWGCAWSHFPAVCRFEVFSRCFFNFCFAIAGTGNDATTKKKFTEKMM